MGTGYKGGFGHTDGEKKHQKYIESSKKASENLIDKSLIKELNNNNIKFSESSEKASENLIDESLIKELNNNNIKFSEKDVLFITKDKTNQTVWLEKGNETAGFEHIKARHGNDFVKAFNFNEDTLHESLYKAIKYGNVVDDHTEIRNGIPSITRVYDYQGNHYLLTGIGTNGFIVSARPQKKEK